MTATTIDYANLPYQDRRGIRSGENYVTRGLFYEISNYGVKDYVRYTLQPYEIEYEGKMLPSAWLIYINSYDEYDAMMKICGNMRQWELILKAFKVAGKISMFNKWKSEQQMIKKLNIRRMLINIINDPGEKNRVSAARLLAQLDKETGVDKAEALEKKAGKVEDVVEEAMSRVVKFAR